MKYLMWMGLLALPGGSAAQIFTDLTSSSGTRNEGLYSTGAAWGDYDNDGDLDLYVTYWGASYTLSINALYENRGKGTFVDVAKARGVDYYGNSSGAAWGDYDNDGDLDLYVVDFFDQDLLYENQESNFVEIGSSRGMVDLIRQGSGTSVAWGDYDNDGWLDFYLGKYYYDNELYQNRGDGTFRRVLDLGLGDKRDTHAISWADYDNDGDLDLYVVNREQENAFYRNDLSTGGTFVEIAAALGLDNKEIGQGAAWGDYDNDGDLDLYLANVGANALYRNDGPDRFVEVAAAAGVRLSGSFFITAMAAWADCDGDGDLDLYLASGGDRQPQRDLLYANQGDGTFREVSAEAGLPTASSTHMALAWGDFDGNGAPDLYLTDGWGAGNRLYQNNTPGNRFIRVQVRGRGPQQSGNTRDAIGAQVRLLEQKTGVLRGYRQVLAGDNAAGLIFGAPDGPYDVEVRFPGRAGVAVRSGVSGGETVTIEEPQP